MTQPAALFTAVADVLAVAYDALEPARQDGLDQVITIGSPPADCCELLAAWTSRIGEYVEDESMNGNSPRPMASRLVRWGADVNLDYFRCVPGVDDDGRFPNPGDTSATSLDVYTDVLAMIRALNRGRTDSTLFSDCATCRVATVPYAVPLEESGQCAGFRITMRLEIT